MSGKATRLYLESTLSDLRDNTRTVASIIILQSKVIGNLVQGINRSKYARDINGSVELLVATQVANTQTAQLTQFTEKGQSAVSDYRGIGSGGMYTYIFLKPFFANAKDIPMYKFVRTAYFIIRFDFNCL